VAIFDQFLIFTSKPGIKKITEMAKKLLCPSLCLSYGYYAVTQVRDIDIRAHLLLGFEHVFPGSKLGLIFSSF
jgi:hypothetical protein